MTAERKSGGSGADRSDYRAAISRASRRMLELQSRLGANPSRDQDLGWLETLVSQPWGRQVTMVASSRRCRSPAFVEKLLEHGYRARFSDPSLTLSCARIGFLAANQVDPEVFGEATCADLEAQSLAHAGNALRILGRLEAADRMLEAAQQVAAGGTGDPLLRARILKFRASVRTYQRRFDESLVLLRKVQRIFVSLKDPHLEGTVLVSMGIVYGYRTESRPAVVCTRRALRLLDRSRDERVFLAALHNLAWFGFEAGLLAEARLARAKVRRLGAASLGKLSHLRVRWLDARFAAREGREGQAAELYEGVRQEFANEGMAYELALVTLDLAGLLVDQGAAGRRVAELVSEVIPLFREIGVEREVMAALLLLERAAGREAVTATLLHQTGLALRGSRLAVPGR